MYIAHEVPLKMLEGSRAFTDFDYALVHLLEPYPEYFDFFKASLQMGREVILDNSVFELGSAFTADLFAHWIEKLQPTYYIIPDVRSNMDATIESCDAWTKYQVPFSKKMGVVQYETYEEAVYCYQSVEPSLDKVAFPFESPLYKTLCPHPDQRIAYTWGRVVLISKLLKDGIINTSKKHHLLGANLPQEFIYYKQMPWIESCDTSNPVVHGLLGIKYEPYGLLSKESLKLNDLFLNPCYNKDLVLLNVKKFRQLIGEER